MINNIHYKRGWICPVCNNGDSDLNAADECNKLIKELDKVTIAHRNGDVWCVEKVCSICRHRWTFKTDMSCTHILKEYKS